MTIKTGTRNSEMGFIAHHKLLDELVGKVPSMYDLGDDFTISSLST